MATLTEVRKQIRLTASVIMIALTILLGYKIVVKLFRAPPPPPAKVKPNPAYGKLPYPKFEEVADIKDSGASYVLDLIASPTLPLMPEFVPVFKNIPKTSSLFGPDRARQIAKNYFFEEEPNVMSDILYSWRDPDLPRSFSIDMVTQNFYLDYEYKKDSEAIVPGNILSISQAENLGISAIQRGGIYPPSISSGKRQVTLLKNVGGEPRIADKAEDYSLAQINFSRHIEYFLDLEKTQAVPAVGPNLYQTPISAFITNNPIKERGVLKLDFSFWNYETESKATYVLKTTDQAWKEIQSGSGSPVYLHPYDLDRYIAYTPEAITQIRAKKVYLAYYDSIQPQEYMQPIYVFECEAYVLGGRKAEYTIYVPAIVDEWLTGEVRTVETTTENQPIPTP